MFKIEHVASSVFTTIFFTSFLGLFSIDQLTVIVAYKVSFAKSAFSYYWASFIFSFDNLLRQQNIILLAMQHCMLLITVIMKLYLEAPVCSATNLSQNIYVSCFLQSVHVYYNECKIVCAQNRSQPTSFAEADILCLVTTLCVWSPNLHLLVYNLL